MKKYLLLMIYMLCMIIGMMLDTTEAEICMAVDQEMEITQYHIETGSGYDAKPGDLVYKILDDGTVEITKFFWQGQTAAEIPAEIDGKRVTSIGENAFAVARNLRSVTIPASVRNIGKEAFSNSGLNSVELPEGVKEVGESAFAGCNSLEKVVLPESVKNIGASVFEGCEYLEYAEIRAALESIPESAFKFCKNLMGVALPKSIKKIEKGAFGECYSLAGIYYAGNRQQWSKINIDKDNKGRKLANGKYLTFDGNGEILKNATIYCDYNNAARPEQQIIACKLDGIEKDLIEINYDGFETVFSMNASSSVYGKKLIYTSSNKKLMSVSENGKVTVKGNGLASITVKAAGGEGYKAASNTVSFVALSKFDKHIDAEYKGNKVVLKWKPIQDVSGYQYSFAYDRRFKNDVKGDVGKKTKLTISGFQTGSKTIYVRMRIYIKNGKKIYYGDWSDLAMFEAPE